MILGVFVRVSYGSCSSPGMGPVRTKEECELAATNLGLSDRTAFTSLTPGRPHGCSYADNDWLNWYEDDPKADPYVSVSCGWFDSGHRYDCLCAIKGKS